MKRSRSSVWGLFLVLLCAAPGLAADWTFEQRLAEAERLRKADRHLFAVLLDDLEADAKTATPRQLGYLRYFRAYQSVVYRNEVEQGIAQAKALFKQATDPELKYRTGALLINSFAVNRKFSEGLRYLNLTLSMRHRVKDTDARHIGINSAGLFYNELGQYSLGLRYANEVLAETPNARNRCVTGVYLQEALYQLGKQPAEDSRIRDDIERCAAVGDAMAANFIRMVLARKWASQGKVADAIRLIETHLPEVQAVGYHRLIADMNALLAELRLREGDAAAAEAHANAAIRQEPHVPSALSMVTAYNILYRIAQSRDDPVAALEMYRRYAAADKSRLTDVKARELAYEIVRHETLQKTQEIALLNQQNRVLQLQQQVDRQSASNTRTLMLMLLLLTGVIGYWAYRVKRMEQTLRHRAEVDALTGICNRQHFTARAEKTLLDCGRAGEEVTLIMFDLDHFKSINDRFGHRAGDWVLQRVAQVCRDLTRQVDYLGRIGGEEFAFLLRGQDVRSATRLADDCRMRLAAIDTGETGFSFPVTASFGVTSTALSGYGLASLFSHADKALYRAKHEGRNRVCVYVPEEVPWQPATLPSIAEPTVQPDPAATGTGHDAPPDAQPASAAGAPHLRIVPR